MTKINPAFATSSSRCPPKTTGSAVIHRAYARYEKGASMVEFSLITLPMILAGVGAVELTHWIYTRQAVGAALMSAAKAGSIHHAHPSAMAHAFKQGTLSLHGAKQSREASPWHIQVRSPSVAVFSDFPANLPGNTLNYPAIRNSYQREQHLKAMGNGWGDGIGPKSGETIFQANTLSLLLTYQYTPLMPGLSTLTPGPLIIRREAQVVMQSNPILWPDTIHTQVSRKPWQGASPEINAKTKLETAPHSPQHKPIEGFPETNPGRPNTHNEPLQPEPDSDVSCVNGELYRNAKYAQKRHPLSPSPIPTAHALQQPSFRRANRVPRLPKRCYAS
jgi:hypothetical protein|tara:strand:+ start:44927 stop:45925 length:999 start_codon:yes stop_codon:yes gene_type:complete